MCGEHEGLLEIQKIAKRGAENLSPSIVFPAI
jgi:hypothetical protein